MFSQELDEVNMTFMDSLANNPASGGIYGQPTNPTDGDVLNVVNQMKDREMRDFKDKANFMADLSLKQEKARAIFDPSKFGGPGSNQYGGPGGAAEAKAPNMNANTINAGDPNQMSGYEKGELGIKQQGVNLESQRLKQTGKLGQEALDIKTAQEKLNQQKSDQINANKQADMERKIEEANQRIELAQNALQSKNTNAEATLAAHKEMAAAVEERHKLEIANMQNRFDTTSKQHQQTIDNLSEQLKQRGRSKTTTELNPDGTKKIVTTERGSAADTINVIGKDGNQYTIPKDKLNDMDADGTPHWKQPDDQGAEE